MDKWKNQVKQIRALLGNSNSLIGPIKTLENMPPMWHIAGLRVFTSIDHDIWYHVSYSHPNRIPTHDETVLVRNVFFRPSVVVVAIFPPIDEYVNHHSRTLHLWERIEGDRLIPDLRVSTGTGTLSI